MEYTWIVLAAALPAGILGYLIGKLLTEKKQVPLSLHTQLDEAHRQLQTSHALETQQRQRLEADWAQLKNKHDEKARELIGVSNDAARGKANLQNAERQLQQLQEQLQESNSLLKAENLQLQQARQTIATLQSRQQHLEEKLNTQQQELADYGSKLKQEFRLLADEVLQNKAESFNAQQETKLTDLLNPLRERISEFKTEMEQRFLHASGERTELSAQVKQMQQLNHQLSQQAQNLTKALTSQVKQQGNWGEEILESILQYVGLQKDLNYFKEYHTANNEGTTIRPDYVVRYPDERYVIIDSKVSLVAYTRFIDAADSQQQKQELLLLAQSIRQHINGLAGRRYTDISGSLDYVFLFVPVEGALITALQTDLSLWQYAYEKHIILVSPTLLITGMKLIHDLWQQDAVNRNALQMAEKAGDLYDKLMGFLDNFENIGKKLDDASKAYDTARRQLSTGKGNAIRQAEAMRLLGAKSTKKLSESWVQENNTDASSQIFEV